MIELARLHNGEDVYGTYEEVEEYAEKNDTCVVRYYDHVNPSTVYKSSNGLDKDCLIHLPSRFLSIIEREGQKETSIPVVLTKTNFKPY